MDFTNTTSLDCVLTTYFGRGHAAVELYCPPQDGGSYLQPQNHLVGFSPQLNLQALTFNAFSFLAYFAIVELVHRVALANPSMLMNVAENVLGGAILGTPVLGKVSDEDKTKMGSFSEASFPLTQEQAKKVESFINQSKFSKIWAPWYSLLANNCVNYVQSVYETAGLPGHFIKHLQAPGVGFYPYTHAATTTVKQMARRLFAYSWIV